MDAPDDMICCPYCMQWIELTVEGDDQGTLVQDCDVCCRPLELQVARDAEGALHVTVSKA